jgi:hypothetical protein
MEEHAQDVTSIAEARKEIGRLALANAKLVKSNNPKQRIKYLII